MNPERKVSEKAFEIHGYSDEFLLQQKKFKEIGDEFLEFIGDKRLIIHNAEFDIGHLNNELTLIGKPKISTTNVIDTLELARNKFPGSGISLDALCKRFRIDNSRRVTHTALIDCELLAKVYINLIDQKEPSLNFQNMDNDIKKIVDTKVSYFKKIVQPSDDEAKKHKEYLKQHLKRNFFN